MFQKHAILALAQKLFLSGRFPISMSVVAAGGPTQNFAHVYNQRCRQQRLYDARRCNIKSWASTVITGPLREGASLGYLPVPKAGSTYLRTVLAIPLGFTYKPTSDVFCLSGLDWAMEQSLALLEQQQVHQAAELVAAATLANGSNTMTCHNVQGGIRNSYRLLHPQKSLRVAASVFTFVAEPLMRLQHGAVQELLFKNLRLPCARSRTCLYPSQAVVKEAVLRYANAMNSKCALQHGSDNSSSGLGGSVPLASAFAVPQLSAGITWHVPAHVIPQSWHISETLDTHALHSLTHLEGVSVSDVVSRLLEGASMPPLVPVAKSSLHGSHGAKNGLANGTRFLAWIDFSPSERSMLCRLLRSDYECLGYALPPACRPCRTEASKVECFPKAIRRVISRVGGEGGGGGGDAGSGDDSGGG